MKKLILTLLTILMFSCIQNNFKDEKEISFKMVNNLPIIEAELNGINAKFLIDSGAGISALDLNAMYIYGYSIDRTKTVQTVTGVGGSQPLYELKNYRFNAYSNDTISLTFKGMDLRKFREDYGILGILGSDYLEKHDYTIDYNKKVIKRK